MSLLNLSQPEQDVMLLLTQARVTPSAVTLAADLWRTTPDWQAFDPYPLLVYILDSLSEQGLCRFKVERGRQLGGGTATHKRVSADLAYDIRLTPKGWELMGLGSKTVEVGSRGRHEREPKRPADLTDYLTQDSHTFGGPIEVDTFPEHRARFPHHIHMYEDDMAMPSPQAKRTQRLADPTIQHDDSEGTRGYNRVTAELEASILVARERLGLGAAYADIARYVDLPERTVRYVLTDLPRLRRTSAGDEAQKSLKERVYDFVSVMSEGGGNVHDVAELRRGMGMADDDHSVMHVLHSLHTQGRIDFDERGNGMGTATVINIRLPKKGKRPRKDDIVNAGIPFDQSKPGRYPSSNLQDDDYLPVAATEPEATTPDTPVTAPSAPEPDAEGYPLLDALLQRERTRLDGDSKGMAFIVAAEAIQDIDPDTARSLMEKAKRYDVPFPSPIEAEYIRYVATHPERTTDAT